ELGRDERVGLGTQNREVGERVGADHLGVVLGAVREARADALRAGDDVSRRDDEAVVRDHDAAPAAPPAAQVRDRRDEALADRDHDPRVGVERVFHCPTVHQNEGSPAFMVAVVAEVAIRRDGAVLWITLNRPEALNALNAPMYAGLAAALEEAGAPEVRAVVLTGAGAAFCAGQDASELQGPTYGIADRTREHQSRAVLAIRRLEKPVIAAVNGIAAGAVLSLALACDARIASDSAGFAPDFSGLGLAPDSGATWLAARLL